MMTSSKDTNLPFSDEELKVFSDTSLIDIKSKLLGKTEQKLSELNTVLAMRSQEWLIDKEAIQTTGKISRGENHHGYPYMVLDYPRNFAVPGGVSLRTLIWWGHYIKVTLHVNGLGNNIIINRLIRNHHKLVESGCKIHDSDSKWSNFKQDYAELPAQSEFEDHLRDQLTVKGVLRIAQFRELSELNQLTSIVISATQLYFEQD